MTSRIGYSSLPEGNYNAYFQVIQTSNTGDCEWVNNDWTKQTWVSPEVTATPVIIPFCAPVEEDKYPPFNEFVLDDGTLKLEYALAGWKKNEIAVKIENGTLVIRGKKLEIKEKHEDEITHRGISTRSFLVKRAFHKMYDLAKLSAKLEDGLLTVVVPVKEDKVKCIEID